MKKFYRFTAFACALGMLLAPALTLAQELPDNPPPTNESDREGGEQNQEKERDVILLAVDNARRDARDATNFFAWCACGIVPIYSQLAAALIVPGPAESKLLGKKPEYVYIYTRAFRSERRGTQLKYTLIGTSVTTVVGIVLLGIACANAANSCNPSCYPEQGFCGDDAEGCNNDAETCNGCSNSSNDCSSNNSGAPSN